MEPGHEIPVPVPVIYNGYTDIPICGKCNTVIDYKDLPVERFLEWLDDCTGGKNDTENLKGKALIRYFGLDKLLETKKEGVVKNMGEIFVEDKNKAGALLSLGFNYTKRNIGGREMFVFIQTDELMQELNSKFGRGSFFIDKTLKF